MGDAGEFGCKLVSKYKLDDPSKRHPQPPGPGRPDDPAHPLDPPLNSGLFTPWTPYHFPGGFIFGDLHGKKDLAGETLFSVTVSDPRNDANFPSERRTVEDPSGKVLTTVYWNRSPPVITSPSCKFLADLRSVSFRSACERRQSGLGLPGLTVCNPSLWRASSE